MTLQAGWVPASSRRSGLRRVLVTGAAVMYASTAGSFDGTAGQPSPDHAGSEINWCSDDGTHIRLMNSYGSIYRGPLTAGMVLDSGHG